QIYKKGVLFFVETMNYSGYISLKHHREEWKGKDELYSALYKLYYRHPSACEIKQTVFTPYDECEHFMDGCDVMLDQLYSYSPGLNALYAMSKGIVVVGGAEEEHYNLLGEDRLRPIINVRPEGNDIYNKLESLLANTNKISQLSADSIEYIKKHHCPIKVAKECLDFWEKN
ncbi:glycosyltransferase family 1 protein, partial [Bacteroides sp. AM23-18]